jgi:5,10-methylene-tetrahydrofolate dehydrogenase/methenyl tetrahydrofolate cyclohydrolase
MAHDNNFHRDVDGFADENITILMDDESGEYLSPTKANIMAAYQKIVADSEDGDAIFCHYSGKSVLLRSVRYW